MDALCPGYHRTILEPFRQSWNGIGSIPDSFRHFYHLDHTSALKEVSVLYLLFQSLLLLCTSHKIEYIRNIIRSTDAMETGTAPGKPLTAESGWKKKKEKKRNIPEGPSISGLFFLVSSVNACLRL